MKKLRHDTHTKPCINCGVTTPQYRSGRDTPYCSRACWLEDKAKPIVKNCPCCEKDFELPAHPSKARHRVYCSNECRYKATSIGSRAKKVMVKCCRGCGTAFDAGTRANRRKYCSQACYWAQRKNIEWAKGESCTGVLKELREQSLPCSCCGYDGLTEVHHIDGDPHNNKLENLAVMCPDCHRRVHRFYDAAQKGMKNLSEIILKDGATVPLRAAI